jgi:glutaredoxin 3
MSNETANTQPKVVMYTSAGCPYCTGAKSLLARKGVVFEEIRVDEEPGRWAEMEARTQCDTVPQTFIGEHHVGGFDDMVELDMEGELDTLLGIAS